MFSVVFLTINSNRICKAQDQTLCHMSTVWPDISVVRVHAHSERVLGSSPSRLMGARGAGVNVTREEKAYGQTGT